MQPDIDHPEIQVNMLGEFSITINGNRITNLKGRTKRVWMLIEYLIANRKKDVSTEMLAKVLWEEYECSDPLNALKNLVYRARELLKEISHDTGAQFITFVRNTYSWNNDYECAVDTEQLEDCWKRLNDFSNPDEERIRACEQALSLYRGEFLPKSTYSSWVVSTGAYYSSIFSDCIQSGCRLLMKQHRLEKVIHICETALVYSPLEEPIHKILLTAYLNSGQKGKALSHYNEASKLFRKELGIELSDSLKQLVGSTMRTNVDLSRIKDDLKEQKGVKGAYFCDFEVFKSVCRVQARMIVRTGHSAYLVLFTLLGMDRKTPEPDDAEPAGRSLKEAILSNLRKSDTVAACGFNQFIVLLPVGSYESAETVAKRVMQKFYLRYSGNTMKIATRINALDTVK
jgi:DNA-binding transcriptional activator of the SARP family